MRVTHGALVADRHSFASPRYRTSQYHRTFVPISVSLWNDLSDPVFDCVGLEQNSIAEQMLRADPILFCWPNLLFLFVYYYYLFFFFPRVVWGWRRRIDSVLTLSQHCTPDSFLIILIIIMITYHDFLPPPRRGSHVKSDNTPTVIKIHVLAHILDT